MSEKIRGMVGWFGVVLIAVASAWAATPNEKVLHGFPSYPTDGLYPWAALLADGKGNYFGTTSFGGAYVNNGESGAVFELSPEDTARATEKVIYSFTGGADGGYPTSNLIFDKNGNLYGTASGGGPNACGFGGGCGTVFELSPNGDGTWKETTLYAFTGSTDGFEPIGGLTFDNNGNLFGTATLGGVAAGECFLGCGSVFELTPNGTGGWNFNLVYDFQDGLDGAGPAGQLLIDQQGNLYGTDGGIGQFEATVYEISPVSGGWKFTTLKQFANGADGQEFVPGLARDASGNLYGAIPLAGTNGYGFVFGLHQSGGAWKLQVLYNFDNKSDGGFPYATPLPVGEGLLYGTTSGGGLSGPCGNDGCGVVYKLSRTAGEWTESTLYEFQGGNDGATPYGSVVPGPGGTLLGTTYYGHEGTDSNPGYGVVYAVKP